MRCHRSRTVLVDLLLVGLVVCLCQGNYWPHGQRRGREQTSDCSTTYG
jgi:hypothetical protein